MAGFIEGVERDQASLFPHRLDDRIDEDSLVRVVELFVGEPDLQGLGFARFTPARTGRLGYLPAMLLKLFICGDLNRIPSSRRPRREAGREVTNAVFERDHLAPTALAAQAAPGGGDLHAAAAPPAKSAVFRSGAAGSTIARPASCGTAARQDPGGGSHAGSMTMEHKHLVDDMRARPGRDPDPMTRRRCTVGHPFGTIKAWMGATPFLTRRLPNVRAEMALNILACSIKRVISLIGIRRLSAEIAT